MIQNITRPEWQIARIKDLQLQAIADYLRRLVREKNDDPRTFEARDLVKGDWAGTPLNIILQHYTTRDTQSIALGKIFKRALFDDQIYTYKMTKESVRGKEIAHYTKVE